jgi:hypothetical protein
MLRRFALLALSIGLISTAASAQPKPSPSPTPPAPGSRAYTEAAVNEYDKALEHYNAVCADPNADLAAMDAAEALAVKASARADIALIDEVEKLPAMIAAKDTVDLALKDLIRLQKEGKDYVAEKKAEDAFRKATKALAAIYVRVSQTVLEQVNGGEPFSVLRNPRHKALREAKRKADEDAKKKAQEKPPTASKTSCAPGTGLAGITENLACQEQHSGSGH